MTTLPNPQVDTYLVDGCMRCPLGATPDCKVNPWRPHLEKLRAILLTTDLKEEYKWSQPVYTIDGKNVAIITALKKSAVIAFFKGVLLKDPHNVLTARTKNMQSDREIVFTDLERITELEPIIREYIQEAIEIEKSGKKVALKKTTDFDVPEELTQKFIELPAFKDAFDALTPGRQRGYLLHFTQPKQSKTRLSRIEKNMDKIYDGKGLHDR